MVRGFLFGVLVLAGLSACSAPRVAVGAGYGIGDVRVGASTSDYGRTVVPSVSVYSGRFYGWTAGPPVRLRGDGTPSSPPQDYQEVHGPQIVRGRPAPGVDFGG